MPDFFNTGSGGLRKLPPLLYFRRLYLFREEKIKIKKHSRAAHFVTA